MPDAQPDRIWDAAGIFRTTALTFDPGDPGNGSLYLCDPTGEAAAAVAGAIAVLRAAELWSQTEPKAVRDDQREAYESQLRFIEAAETTVNGVRLVLVRCDHPKFPSSGDRFEAWKQRLRA